MGKNKSGGGKFVLGAAIGAAIGAIAGILAAPKSGKETREDIKKKAGDVKKAADKKVSKGKKAAKSWKNNLFTHGKDDEKVVSTPKPAKKK
ncbi:MAG: YtxH domain-containing protein [Candidatus Nomurabacteria bacterium]|nr:YtxH domain-containing protein [Candidatus Nomurabacteria bacterium]